jgi:hypothetical protein
MCLLKPKVSLAVSSKAASHRISGIPVTLGILHWTEEQFIAKPMGVWDHKSSFQLQSQGGGCRLLPQLSLIYIQEASRGTRSFSVDMPQRGKEALPWFR